MVRKIFLSIVVGIAVVGIAFSATPLASHAAQGKVYVTFNIKDGSTRRALIGARVEDNKGRIMCYSDQTGKCPFSMASQEQLDQSIFWVKKQGYSTDKWSGNMTGPNTMSVLYPEK